MKYLLDAYNIIGRSDHIQLSEKDKEQRFIEWMQRIIRPKDHFMIVFDGQDPLIGFARTHKYKQMTVIYTEGTRNADRYIIDKTSKIKSRMGVMVVSSDRAIQDAAKQNRIAFQDVDTFLKTYRDTRDYLDGKPSRSVSENEVTAWLNEFSSDD